MTRNERKLGLRSSLYRSSSCFQYIRNKWKTQNWENIHRNMKHKIQYVSNKQNTRERKLKEKKIWKLWMNLILFYYFWKCFSFFPFFAFILSLLYFLALFHSLLSYSINFSIHWSVSLFFICFRLAEKLGENHKMFTWFNGNEIR